MVLREVGQTIYVGCYAIEVYLPYDYMTKAYRGYEYFIVVGTEVRYFAVGMMRSFETQKEFESSTQPDAVPLAVPMVINSAPSTITTRDVKFTKNSPTRKCIVLTYYKDDPFMTTTDCIKSSSNVMIIMNQLEGGKFDFFSPEVMVQILQDAQSDNNVKLRIPTEEEEIFIAERYRDPSNQNKKARFSEKLKSDQLVSYNMRQEGMNMSTYQAWINEDINTSLIVSSNRHNEGVVDKIGPMEAIVRGMDMSEYSKERDRRVEKEKLLQEQEKEHRG